MKLFKRPLLVLLPAVTLLVTLALITNVVPFRQLIDQSNELEASRSHLASVEASNRVLSAQVVALETPTEIERLARERLGLVRPGEQAFVVIDPDGLQPPQLTTDTTLPEPDDVVGENEETSWLQRLWDYLTGQDLEGE